LDEAALRAPDHHRTGRAGEYPSLPRREIVVPGASCEVAVSRDWPSAVPERVVPFTTAIADSISLPSFAVGARRHPQLNVRCSRDGRRAPARRTNLPPKRDSDAKSVELKLSTNSMRQSGNILKRGNTTGRSNCRRAVRPSGKKMACSRCLGGGFAPPILDTR
jgi:hypothetical protein